MTNAKKKKSQMMEDTETTNEILRNCQTFYAQHLLGLRRKAVFMNKACGLLHWTFICALHKSSFCERVESREP